MRQFEVTLIDRLGNKEVYGTYQTLEEACEACNGWPKDEIVGTTIRIIRK